MNNQVAMDKFFELHKSKLDRLHLLHKPDHIFNADESGIDLNARAGKVVVDKKFKHGYSQQKAPKADITAVVCYSAPGQCLKAMIIFEKLAFWDIL